MRRREFMALLGGAATTWPLAVRAQQAGKLPIIGFLGANTPSVQSRWTAAFVQRLRELGWIEGRNVAIEYRWAETRFERSPEIIAEFVRLKVDVIVTHAIENIRAAKQRTSVIPIVFAAVAEPVGIGVVNSPPNTRSISSQRQGLGEEGHRLLVGRSECSDVGIVPRWNGARCSCFLTPKVSRVELLRDSSIRTGPDFRMESGHSRTTAFRTPFGHGRKRRRSDSGAFCKYLLLRLNLVAGVGFEPTTFRL